MKAIILLLLSVTAHAQLIAKIDLADPKFADMQIEAKDQAALDKRLIKFLEHPNRRGHVKWIAGITEPDHKPAKLANAPCKTEVDMEGETRVLCPHTDAFTVTIEDITAEVEAKKAKNGKKDKLKKKLKKGKDLTLKEINELLRR